MYPHNNQQQFNNAPPPPGPHQSAQPSYLNPQFAPPPSVPKPGGGNLLKTLNFFATKPSYSGGSSSTSPLGPALGPALGPGPASPSVGYGQAPWGQPATYQQQQQQQQMGMGMGGYQQQQFHQQPTAPPQQQQNKHYSPQEPAPPPPYEKPQNPHYSGGGGGCGTNHSPSTSTSGASPFVPTANYNNSRPTTNTPAPPAGPEPYTDYSHLLDFTTTPPIATAKFRNLLHAIAANISKENTDASPPCVLSPAKLATFFQPNPAYASFFSTGAVNRPVALATFYRAISAEFLLLPGSPPVPALTAAGFTTLIMMAVHLQPELAAQILSAYTSGHGRQLREVETGRAFPPSSQPIPRSSIPSAPDTATAHRLASTWNETIYAPSDSPDCEDDLAKSRKQLIALQSEFASQTAETQRYRREVETVRAQKDREIAGMKKTTSEHKRDLEALRVESAKKNQELLAEVTKWKDLSATLTTDRDGLRGNLDATNARLSAATQTLAEKDAQIAQAREDVSTANLELQQACSDADSARQEVHVLQAQVHATASQSVDILRYRADVDRLQAQVAQLRTAQSTQQQQQATEVRKAVATSAELVSARADIDALREEIRKKDSEIARLNHQVKAATVLPAGLAPGVPPTPANNANNSSPTGGYQKKVYERRPSGPARAPSAGPSPTPPPPAGFEFNRATTGPGPGPKSPPLGFEFNRAATGGVGGAGRKDSGTPAPGRGRNGSVLPYPENP